jgi:hypothetical protein
MIYVFPQDDGTYTASWPGHSPPSGHGSTGEANMKTRLDTEWKDYRASVMPPDAGPVQVQECRRAFYAGAQAFFTRAMAGLTPGPEPAAEDLQMMSDLSAELQQFYRDVKEGRA